jgi:membrane protein involved in colicin uptake
MKTRLLILSIAACTPMLFAEPQAGQNPSPTCPPPGGGPMRDKMREKMKENLPPELRARFEAAHAKAMQDPAVQELKRKADASAQEFRKAMREAMMKADPGLAEAMKAQMGAKFHGGKDGKPGEPPGLANLSEGDRQKLKAAREKAKDDPTVQAAEAKKQAAKTPEEHRAARQEFHKAMHDALLKADPTIGPILDQLKPPQGPPPPTPGSTPGT